MAGKANYEAWKPRMEVKLKRENLGDLVTYGDSYPMVLYEKRERNPFFEEEEIEGEDLRVIYSECLDKASKDNNLVYDLIIENTVDHVMLRLRRQCEGDGLGAWENLGKWYGVTSTQSQRVLGLKERINSIQMTDFETFEMYVEEVLQLQASLEKMGKGVDIDYIKNAVSKQVPEDYKEIIPILSREKFTDPQEWCDEVIAHVENGELMNGEKPKKRNTIASQASNSRSYTIQCQFCEEQGHDAKSCPMIAAAIAAARAKRPSRITEPNDLCNYCKQPGHVVKNCPKAKKKDEARLARANRATTIEESSDADSNSEDSNEDSQPTIRFTRG